MKHIKQRLPYCPPGLLTRPLHGAIVAMCLLPASGAHAHSAHVNETQVAQTAAVEQGPSPMTSQTARNYVTANAAGMVVVLDRDTGKTRPLTSAEALHLAEGIRALVNQSTDGLVEVRNADGSYSMDLQGRFQSVMLAKREDDGTVSQACVDNVEAAASFFAIDPALVGALRSGVTRPSSGTLETR